MSDRIADILMIKMLAAKHGMVAIIRPRERPKPTRRFPAGLDRNIIDKVRHGLMGYAEAARLMNTSRQRVYDYVKRNPDCG